MNCYLLVTEHICTHYNSIQLDVLEYATRVCNYIHQSMFVIHTMINKQARIKVDVGPRQRIIVGPQSDLTGTGSVP